MPGWWLDSTEGDTEFDAPKTNKACSVCQADLETEQHRDWCPATDPIEGRLNS